MLKAFQIKNKTFYFTIKDSIFQESIKITDNSFFSATGLNW